MHTHTQHTQNIHVHTGAHRHNTHTYTQHTYKQHTQNIHVPTGTETQHTQNIHVHTGTHRHNTHTHIAHTYTTHIRYTCTHRDTQRQYTHIHTNIHSTHIHNTHKIYMYTQGHTYTAHTKYTCTHRDTQTQHTYVHTHTHAIKNKASSGHWRMDQWVKHLLCHPEDQSSDPSTNINPGGYNGPPSSPGLSRWRQQNLGQDSWACHISQLWVSIYHRYRVQDNTCHQPLAHACMCTQCACMYMNMYTQLKMTFCLWQAAEEKACMWDEIYTSLISPTMDAVVGGSFFNLVIPRWALPVGKEPQMEIK